MCNRKEIAIFFANIEHVNFKSNERMVILLSLNSLSNHMVVWNSFNDINSDNFEISRCFEAFPADTFVISRCFEISRWWCD